MSSLEELRAELERYRRLLGNATDPRVRDVLKRVIDETTAALEKIDPDRRS